MIKNLDISTTAIKAITIEAVNKGMVFKHRAEEILENHAKRLIDKDTKSRKSKK